MKVILIAAALSAAIVLPAAADHGHGKSKAKGRTPTVIELTHNQSCGHNDCQAARVLRRVAYHGRDLPR